MNGMALLAVLVLMLGCSGGGASDPDGSSATDVGPPLGLYVFDCGRLKFDSIEAFGVSDDESDVRQMAVPCFVVEHPQGRLLWDGGLPSAVAESEGWQGEGMQQRLDRPFAEQLAELGLDMGSFDFVAFSHMHFDHVGVANEVSGGTLLIQRPEHDAAFGDDPSAVGFDQQLYTGLRDLRQQILDGDHDVFGDGRVRILSLPGHTPGHQALFVDLAETGPVVLSGDLYHLRFSRQNRRVPTFNFDAEQTLASMDRMESFVEDTGAELWIEHELAHFEQLDLAPESYR